MTGGYTQHRNLPKPTAASTTPTFRTRLTALRVTQCFIYQNSDAIEICGPGDNRWRGNLIIHRLQGRVFPRLLYWSTCGIRVECVEQ